MTSRNTCRGVSAEYSVDYDVIGVAHIDIAFVDRIVECFADFCLGEDVGAVPLIGVALLTAEREGKGASSEITSGQTGIVFVCRGLTDSRIFGICVFVFAATLRTAGNICGYDSGKKKN